MDKWPASRGYKSVRHPGSQRRNPLRNDVDIQDRDGANVVLETISQVPALAQTSLRQWRL
jgi:hypothetical protein